MSATADERLAATLQTAGDGAFATGPDGKVVLWNAAAERLLGYTAREAIGRACCDIFAGYDDDGNRLCDRDCHVRTRVQHREPVHSFDMRTRTKAGRPIWLNVSVVGVPGTENGNRFNVHFLRDVTAGKELLGLVHERIAAATPAPTNGATAPPDLTRRELEILRLLTQGLNTARAAERLHVSRATVRNHIQNIFAKLGVHSRLEAVAYAARHRLY